jgi:amidohydrolase
MTLPAACQVPPVVREVARQVEALGGELRELSLALHARPELKFAEHFAAERLGMLLTRHGFWVQPGAGGLETAFVARHGASRPGPTIAVLCEYDALPGIGHGCGHNLIAAGGAVAAIAAAAARPEHPGTLLVIGTPGEEMGGAGKIRLAEAGVFDGVDAAMMWHPGDRSLSRRHGLAAAHLRFAFTGVPSHAAKTPWEGRSALAAAQLFLNAVDSLRQFVRPTVRMHGVVVDGGDAPNVVPGSATVEFYARDTTTAGAREVVRRLELAARGAALATETSVEVSETGPLYAARRSNAVMEQVFAETVGGLGLAIGPAAADEPAGSSDIGNLSELLPIIHPYVQIAPPGTASHSTAMRDAAATETAHQRAELAATGLGVLAARLLDEPALLDEVRAAFVGEGTGG